MLFLAIEVNLVFWLMLLGNALHASGDKALLSGAVPVDGRIILAGLLFAAIVQHWAYYRLKRSAGKPVPEAAAGCK
jgi:hypothetical protein